MSDRDVRRLDAEAVWRNLHRPLLRFIASRVSDRATAEDLLQDVMLRVHQHAADLQDDSSVDAWIYQIARNAVVDHYRKAAIRREQPVDTPADPTPATWADDEDGAAQTRAELTRCLAPLVDQLSPDYREALLLTDLGTHTQTEAATIVGLSTSGMKSRVQRGRHQLRQLLSDCCSIHLDRRGSVIDYSPNNPTDCDCRADSNNRRA